MRPNVLFEQNRAIDELAHYGSAVAARNVAVSGQRREIRVGCMITAGPGSCAFFGVYDLGMSNLDDKRYRIGMVSSSGLDAVYAYTADARSSVLQQADFKTIAVTKSSLE